MRYKIRSYYERLADWLILLALQGDPRVRRVSIPRPSMRRVLRRSGPALPPAIGPGGARNEPSDQF